MSQIREYPSISHIRVYPNPTGGFDIHIRHREGLSLHDTKPTIEEALSAAHSLNGDAWNEPVFTYSRDLETMLKTHPWERLALNPPRHPTTSIGE